MSHKSPSVADFSSLHPSPCPWIAFQNKLSRVDESPFQELDSDVTESVANDPTANDLPAFHADSKVHDYACGSGAITLGTMATNPPSRI